MAAAVSPRFDNSYARELEGFSLPWRPDKVPAPKTLFFNEALAEELGFDVDALRGEAGAALFAGNTVPEGAEPVAQAYAGHQFGGFSPQLGDGRAVLLGEVLDRAGRRRDIALKGSGRTPFSRGGDGKAAVGPMLREVLIGEAMHALGIPTTRALAVVATGEPVQRETVLPGAVLTASPPATCASAPSSSSPSATTSSGSASSPSTPSHGTTPSSSARRAASSACSRTSPAGRPRSSPSG
jgi:uncharacterized protein YdiU (UPF0061 family)